MVSSAANVIFNLAPVLFRERLAVNPGKFLQLQPGDGRLRPDQDFGIAVLANDVSVNVL